MPAGDDQFDDVAEALGIPRAFTHASGRRVEVPRATRARLLEALGYPGGDPDGLVRAARDRDLEDWRRGMPPVVVVPHGPTISVPLYLSQAEGTTLRVCLRLEAGVERCWQVGSGDLEPGEARAIEAVAYRRYDLVISDAPPPGYHRLRVDIAEANGSVSDAPGSRNRPLTPTLSPFGGEGDPLPSLPLTGGDGGDGPLETLLIVTPRRCYLPPLLEEGRRLWGFSVQLYGLRCRGDAGIGDFSCLARLAGEARALGAAFVGVNPLHALFPERPDRCSPYSPNSRLFLNPLYIDVAATGCPPMGAQGLVDYGDVTGRKLQILERRFAERRASGKLAALREKADPHLLAFAVFEALREKLAFSGPGGSWIPWWRWPEEFRRPDSPAVAAFADRHAGRVDFHLFLQAEAYRQLERAGAGLPLGLYRDIAVGMDRDGADAWLFQEAIPPDVSVGCPPDLRNPLGQDWGVVPFSPHALRDCGYRPFIETIRANMRGAGLVRLDHAFQLMRLFWVPLGSSPAEGGYVRYPMEDLLGIIALESHRNRCGVVAEDLGTIPRGFRERIMDWNTLSSRILHRERDRERSYLPPASYPAMSTVALGTHDQATLTGFWRGRDVAVRTALGLYPSPEAAREAAALREKDREQLAAALTRHAGLDDDPGDPESGPSDELRVAAHRFLARTPSRLMVIQPDDLTGEVEQVNLPATIDQHPNWRRRYAVAVEGLAKHPLIRRAAEMLREEGRGIEQG